MAVITPKQFITTIATKCHGETAATGFAAHKMRWQLRGISERLAVEARQLGDQSQSVLSCKGHLGMFRAEMGRHRSSERRLIETSTVGESDSEAAHWPRALSLEQGRDQRGINPA